MHPDYLVVSIHDFKTNLSKYLKVLEGEHRKGIVVRRYKKQVAILLPLKRKTSSQKNVD